jgi:ferredoxin-NADP reductase
MGVSEAAGHDRGYHPLEVARVVEETADARSYVLAIPDDLSGVYRYQAGQFVTLRIRAGEQTLYRSYSMSSSPEVDRELAITVKRVPGGAVSNHLIDTIAAGDRVEASAPAGVFRLGPAERRLVMFAAGSGITPVISIIKVALALTSRPVTLLYANRDADSVIFRSALDELATNYGDRLSIAHRHDVDDGFVDAAAVASYLELAKDADCYICGPAAFMDVVETGLLDGGVPREQIHIERFSVAEPADETEAVTDDLAPTGATEPATITIELGGATKSGKHHPGTTILQTARQFGMKPPFSCEAGNCATCMAKLVEGEVKMHVNDALFDDEVADGWILTCQSVPTTPSVHVRYED